MTQTLGQEKLVYGWTCQGAPGPREGYRVALQIVASAGMTSARRARIDRYPYNGGGGRGYTLYQPLMESYLVIDVYSEIEETKITLATCMPERLHPDIVKDLLSRLIGQVIPGRGGVFKL